MRDRILISAIVASLVVHLAAICIVGRTSASRMNADHIAAPVSRLTTFDLVASPEDALKPKPKPIPVEVPAALAPKPEQPVPSDAVVPPTRLVRDYNPSRAAFQAGGRPNSVPGNPGGRLNVGSLSSQGDLGGSWDHGKTPVGWVAGSDSGTGRGAGNSPGVGAPEPVKGAAVGPSERPAPSAPPQPAMVSVRVCDVSGMLPGEYCKHTHVATFVEGKQPTRTCNQCIAEHKSRLADQEMPSLVRDSQVSLPGSVEEGMSLEVEIGYTVTAEGSVTGVHVVKSCGNRAVDRAVADSASGLKYKPAVQDGVARSVKMTRPYKIRT